MGTQIVFEHQAFRGGMTLVGNEGTFVFGTDARPITKDVANLRFMQAYFDNGATSGDNRGFYLKLSMTGAGGGGEALRAFTDCKDVACSTAHGAHISLGFGTTGSITGLGVAGRNTLSVPNSALSGGTYGALAAEGWAEGSSSDVSGATSWAIIRAGIIGDASGMATIDTAGYLLDLYGFSPGASKLIGNLGNEPTWTSKTRLCRVRMPDGSLSNLLLVDP